MLCTWIGVGAHRGPHIEFQPPVQPPASTTLLFKGVLGSGSWAKCLRLSGFMTLCTACSAAGKDWEPNAGACIMHQQTPLDVAPSLKSIVAVSTTLLCACFQKSGIEM